MEKEKLALGGSVLSAIAASLCCIGPLVAVIVGASGFAAAGLFAQWRPLFLTIAALLLAAAWYLTYRRPKAGNCSTGGCPQHAVAKWSKVILWLATALVIAIAAFPTVGIFQQRYVKRHGFSPLTQISKAIGPEEREILFLAIANGSVVPWHP